jgi:uncharacterized Rossmann fold enzyme
MSSHHFVRDGQEPALIIANGAECDSELLGQLLEWNPYVLVLDGALQRVLDMNIRVDAVLGDFDSVAPGWDSHAAMQGVRIVDCRRAAGRAYCMGYRQAQRSSFQ